MCSNHTAMTLENGDVSILYSTKLRIIAALSPTGDIVILALLSSSVQDQNEVWRGLGQSF